ncbi:MAG: winged helix-turn-helix domain-containing protein [Micavibrio sp.]
MDSLPLKILKETARRQNLPLGDGAVDLAAFGARPRLGAILDRMGEQKIAAHLAQPDSMAVGPYRFFPADGYLEADGKETRLTEKERDILLLLLEAGGEKVARKTLLDHVWGYAGGVETHTLETHVYRLRQKIERDPAQPQILLTEEDGYSLGMG